MNMKLLFLCLFTCLAASGLTPAQDIDLAKIIPDSSATVFTERLVYLAWKNQPYNKGLAARVTQAEENLFLSKWSWLNTLNFTYQYNPNTSLDPQTATALPKFGVGVSVNLGTIFSVPGKIRIAEEDRTVAIANLQQQMVYTRAEVLRRYANYKRSLDLLQVRTQAVDDSESSLRLARHKYETGELPLEEYNKVLRSYTDNMERKVTSLGDVEYHKASLEEMIGCRLEEVK